MSDDDLFSANIYVIAVATLVMIIGLVIVYFVLNSIVRIIMQERQPIIGSFRSVGASIKKMNFILLCEMGTYGAIGGILGSISAISIFYSMLKSITSVMFELNYSSINIITFVATTILMILFQLMLSISEILRFKDISIKDCMFNKGDYTYKRDFKKLILGLAFIIIPTVTILYKYQISYFMGIISIAAIFAGVTMVYPYITESFKLISKKTKSPLLKIAIDNISNNKLQISTNIIIIILTSLSIVAISFFNNYMSNLYKKENLFSSDLYIHSYAEDIDFERRLEAIDEIENVSSLYIKDISHEEMKIGGVIQSLSIDGGIKLVNSTNINNLIKNSKLINTNEKNWLNMKDDEIIMSNYFKNKYHIKKGDVITIEFKDEANDIEYYQYYNLKVIDFADTSLINPLTIIVSEEIFNCEQTVDQFDEHYFINLKENVDKKLVKKKIKEEMNDTSVTIENKESYKETLKSEKKEITNIILTIIGIIIAIGLIGIMNNQTVAFLQRSRELAVLYSTCMSRKKLASMILKELLISYSLTTIISVLVALVLNKLIIYTCDVLGILIELKFSILYTILLLFVIALIMLGLYIFIRIKIKGLNIVEELKYE